MTKPPREAVATMDGRELDAAVHEFVMGRKVITTAASGKTFYWSDEVGLLGLNALPCYCSEEGPAFFAMLKAVREKGWTVEIYGKGECWYVVLVHTAVVFHEVDVEAPTLPLALARAALLTTTPPEETSHDLPILRSRP